MAAELDRQATDYPTGMLPWMWAERADLTKALDGATARLDAAVQARDGDAFDKALTDYRWTLKAARMACPKTLMAPTELPTGKRGMRMPNLPDNTLFAVGLASNGTGTWVRVVAAAAAAEPVSGERRDDQERVMLERGGK